MIQPTPIPGWRYYGATPDGTIYSRAKSWKKGGTWRALKPYSKQRYDTVCLHHAGQQIGKVTVHTLIALTFHGPRPSPRHQVRHINGNPRDNRAENLAWGTAAENIHDRDVHGRTQRGSRHRNARLTEGEVSQIKALIALGVSTRVIALSHGVVKGTIDFIKSGRSWRHVAPAAFGAKGLVGTVEPKP